MLPHGGGLARAIRALARTHTPHHVTLAESPAWCGDDASTPTTMMRPLSSKVPHTAAVAEPGASAHLLGCPPDTGPPTPSPAGRGVSHCREHAAVAAPAAGR